MVVSARFVVLMLMACLPGVAIAQIDVTTHGAVGDGLADDTAAIQAALDAAGAEGGGVVFLPKGEYRVEGHLTLPERVTLEGTWRAPVRGLPAGKDGSVLLAFAGQGDAEGEPFIKMGTSSTLKGLSIFYPEQIRANPPHAYPWTVQTNGATDNITILDVTMVNPYKAVDLGTYPAGRHLVRNLYAYPLYQGLYVNQCYDVGRLENIHFWPFWDIDPNSPLWEFTRENATAFIMGKTDGEMGYGLFTIFYKVSMHFIAGPIYDAERNIVNHAAGSGTYTNCYLDVSPTAVLVDAAMENAGVSFVNSSFMAQVVVNESNRGTVKFTGCGFWGTNDCDSHAVLEGHGPVQFSACHFSGWDRQETGAHCIDANNRRLILTGSDFITERRDHQVLRLGPRLRAAVVTSNTMPGGVHITNDASPRAQIVLRDNVSEPAPSFIEKWLLLGPFPNPAAEGEIIRAGIDTDYLESLGGEMKAVFTPETEVSHDGHTLRARKWEGRNGLVNLAKVFETHGQVAYAFTQVHSEGPQTGWFDFALNDGGKVFVNGAEVYRRFSPLGMAAKSGIDCFRAELQPGWNTILVKVEDGGGSKWEFIAEAYGEEGETLEAAVLPGS
jgi:hypothetical protein